MNPSLSGNMWILFCLEIVLAMMGAGSIAISSIVFYVLRNKYFHLRGIVLTFASSMFASGLGLIMLMLAMSVPDRGYLAFTVAYLFLSATLMFYVAGAVWMQIRAIRMAFHDIANRQQEIVDTAYLDSEKNERQSGKTMRFLDAFDSSLTKYIAKAKGAS